MQNNKQVRQPTKTVCTVDSNLARIKESLLQLANASANNDSTSNPELRAAPKNLSAQSLADNRTVCTPHGMGQMITAAAGANEILARQSRNVMEPFGFITHRTLRRDVRKHYKPSKLSYIIERISESDEVLESSYTPQPRKVSSSAGSSPESSAVKLVVTAVIEPPPRKRHPDSCNPQLKLKVRKNAPNAQKNRNDLEAIEVVKSPKNEKYRNSNPFREITLPKSLLKFNDVIMRDHQYSNPVHDKENYNIELTKDEVIEGKAVKKRKLQRRKFKKAPAKPQVFYEDTIMRDAVLQDDESLYDDEAIIGRTGQYKRKLASKSKDEPTRVSLQQHQPSDSDDFPELEVEVESLHKPFIFEPLTSSGSDTESSIKVDNPDEIVLMDTSGFSANNEYSINNMEVAENINNSRTTIEKHNASQFEENSDPVAPCELYFSNYHPMKSWSETGSSITPRSFKNIVKTFLSSYEAVVQRSLQLFQIPSSDDDNNVAKLGELDKI